MLAAAFGVLGAVVAHHHTDILEGASAELAGKRSRHTAFIRLMVLSMRVLQAIIANQTAKISFFLPAMDANKRPTFISFKERVLALSVRMF